MSEGFKILSDSPDHKGFTITKIGGCRIVHGSVPMSEIAMLTHGFSKEALMAPDIAERIGASFVIGEPNDLARLRAMDLPVSPQRREDSEAATQLGLYKVAIWLRIGERGSSSNAMCKHIFGVPRHAGDSYPYDPDDLRRCAHFLDATDAHDKVPLLATVSPQWAGLVERWNELLATLKEEMAVSNSAPKTYALMQQVLNAR